MSKRYEVVCMNGTVLHNNGKGYVSPAAAVAAADRRKLCPVETRQLGEKAPHKNDAAGWDAYRLQSGIASR